MKKLRGLLFVLAFCLLWAPTVSAADEFATAGDLREAWYTQNDYENPYPAYICGVWTEDGTLENLTFAVTEDEAGERGKQEILDAVADDSTVKFVYHRYSYAELSALQREMEPNLGKNGVNGCGVDEMNNCLLVYIDPSDPGAEAFMAEMLSLHGDKIAFEKNSGFVTTDDLLIAHALGAAASEEKDAPTQKSTAILVAVGGALLAGGICLSRKLRKNKEESE